MDGMKLLALLAVALSLLSATAAKARHHRHTHHAAIPMPRERPVVMPRGVSNLAQDVEKSRALGTARGTHGWTMPQQSVADQLVMVGTWRLQTDLFYRR